MNDGDIRRDGYINILVGENAPPLHPCFMFITLCIIAILLSTDILTAGSIHTDYLKFAWTIVFVFTLIILCFYTYKMNFCCPNCKVLFWDNVCFGLVMCGALVSCVVFLLENDSPWNFAYESIVLYLYYLFFCFCFFYLFNCALRCYFIFVCHFFFERITKQLIFANQ